MAKMQPRVDQNLGLESTLLLGRFSLFPNFRIQTCTGILMEQPLKA
jgi:hypothetical protein